MGTRTWYLYPSAQVRVHAGMGTGGPKNTHGLPVTIPIDDLAVQDSERASDEEMLPLIEDQPWEHDVECFGPIRDSCQWWEYCLVWQCHLMVQFEL